MSLEMIVMPVSATGAPPAHVLTTSTLTLGELLLVQRRRAGETQADAARRHRVTYREYRALERDEQKDLPRVRRPAIRRLRVYEWCLVRRRRAGLSLVDVSEALGVSSWWVCQMEAGTAPPDRLVQFWRQN
jgi:hypothetical protein